LDGKGQCFKSIPEVIAHYKKFPIVEEDQQVLGVACDRRTSGISVLITIERTLNYSFSSILEGNRAAMLSEHCADIRKGE
jgi:hypothetical protein